MSFVFVAPDILAAAAKEVAAIGSSLDAAHAATAASTTSVVAAAEDEVSAAIAKLFGNYGQEFQSLGAQAGQAYSSFVQSLTSAGTAYSGRRGEQCGQCRGRQCLHADLDRGGRGVRDVPAAPDRSAGRP